MYSVECVHLNVFYSTHSTECYLPSILLSEHAFTPRPYAAMPTLSRGAEHTFGPSYRSLPTPGARPNQSNPPAAARPVTDTHAAHRDPDGSDTEATGDDEAMCAGGSGRYSLSKYFLSHAIRHFVRQLMFGGHHAFYDTCLSEYTHQSVVKWAGSRVRMRGHNQTHDDMGRLVWEDAILAQLVQAMSPPKGRSFGVPLWVVFASAARCCTPPRV